MKGNNMLTGNRTAVRLSDMLLSYQEKIAKVVKASEIVSVIDILTIIDDIEYDLQLLRKEKYHYELYKAFKTGADSEDVRELKKKWDGIGVRH